ncbi:cell cycle checkpoint control protein RAD9A [Ipomoea triloba]|uniref:cell cycle checkpoint control protein RAD9A n=1 Tax=Ipomoea triloba TaxID=35885 RepID=UPI00125E85B1|nr:cell cycle checkpoint control protein RAD9A [Ipomoea triloba]
MEFKLSGNELKTFTRSITCLARIGNELVVQASDSLLTLLTLNSSRTAHLSITFKPDFFNVYTISAGQVKFSVLIKAVCSVLRTPFASIDHLSVSLPDHDASKVQWTLDCYNGIRKAYWINCNVNPDIQQLSIDRTMLPSNLVVRPRDLNRLLSNFQAYLQEITVIATEPSLLPPDSVNEIGGKSVELRSYIDPTKENDSSLHTQLWIDPTEEFLQYSHAGNPVDVTFGVKDLKAFVSFCEGCEVDVRFHFKEAGEPVLMEPKFGLDDGSSTNFDAALVLATMLTSQLNSTNSTDCPQPANTSRGQADQETGPQTHDQSRGSNPEPPSGHTRIWSDLSGNGGNAVDMQVQVDKTLTTNEQQEIQRIGSIRISKVDAAAGNMPCGSNDCRNVETDHMDEPRGSEATATRASKYHPSNWVDADEEDDEGDDDSEFVVEATPPHH